MSTIVVGYGSIGARHARILTELGQRSSVVSSRAVDFPVLYTGLADAIIAERPDRVVIANATSQHHDTLCELARLGYEGDVLVEKPLFHGCLDLPTHHFRQAFVAYNLRFHPVIRRLKSLLEGERILSVQAYAGQYLPEWRPPSDYRSSYSAAREQGGGALRDLSHELDCLIWLLGGWERVAAVGGHFGPLEISSDDVFSLMVVTPACPVVTVQVNYLDRAGRRFMIINTAGHTIEADLLKGTIIMDRDMQIFSTERDQSYRAMHEEFLSDSGETLCTLAEGYETLRLIAAAELAAACGEWVCR